MKSVKSVTCVLPQLTATHYPPAQEFPVLMVSCMTCVALKVCLAKVQAARASVCLEFVRVSLLRVLAM